MLCVLRLANTGFVQCFYLWFPSPFAHVYLFVLSVCFASQTPGLCSASIFDSLSLCTRLFVMSVCFASQTPCLCSASIFGSLPLLHTFICLFCQCTSPRKLRVCAVLLSWFPSPSAHVYLFCQCASPRKHRVCFVLPFCTRLCQCASPHKLRVCAVLFPPSLINSLLCFVCTLQSILCCAFRLASFGYAWGQSQSFYLALLYSEVFVMLTLPRKFRFCPVLFSQRHFKFHRVCFSMYSLCVYRLPNIGLWGSVQFPVSKF